MRVHVCLSIFTFVLLSGLITGRKAGQNNTEISQKNTTQILQNLIKSNQYQTVSFIIPKSCQKKKIRFVKIERLKLKKLLKQEVLLKNKSVSSRIISKLDKIKTHLKKCRMKMKHKRLKNKKRDNIQEMTTRESIRSFKEINLEQAVKNDFKAQSDDYTIIESDKLHGDLLPKTSINSQDTYGNSQEISKHNSNNPQTTPAQEAHLNLDKLNLDVQDKFIQENKTDKNAVSNKINYANLMLIETTTLPVLKNITLNKIMDEFNAIHNEIQEILPNKAEYYKILYKEKENKWSSRCTTKKGGCQHKCHPFGVKLCSCMAGFKLINRKKCLDINECLINNGGCEMFCHNTPGSYYCSCKKGFRLSDNHKSCIDINECLLRNGHGPCQDTCINTNGSYQCSCTGLNGTRLSEDKHSCLDIDECLADKAGCSHQCVNTLGRAYCVCPEGMILGRDWKTCIDVNECHDEEVEKHCKYGCVNTVGSFRCANSYELQNDQMVPDLVACPKLFPPKLGFLECNRKKSLGVKMRSKSGRKRVTNRPGTFCQLVCPDGYYVEGIFKITCGYNGEWFGETSGLCKREL